MKKIIDNKVYDTDTARFVGSWANNFYPSDFQYVEEKLYCKKTGEYFLYGWGNAQSRYAESMGQNSWGSGSKIIPLTYEAAREWAEEHLEADDYMKEFEVVEDDEVIVTTLNIRKDTRAKIDQLRAKYGLTMTQIIDEAINNYEK